MKVIYLILAVVFIVGILLIKTKKTGTVVANTLPNTEKENDKLVVVKEANESDLKKAISDFCHTYNENDYAVLPRFIRITDREYAITFPYDVNFDKFCFFVNYLKYPIGIDRFSPNVLAWTTLNQEDHYAPKQCIGKKVMLYIADDDTEYDNVFLTNEGNIGFKIDFAFNSKNDKPLDFPKKNYSLPTVDKDSLSEKLFEDFR
ncbi:MAG: hypothetical protein LBV75_05315 [Paludibacter sp.]|jgi:hypothetical protein|nr:hypothetical protein [Paludibacter sp.]